MAKRRQKEAREVTRKETVLRRRDVEMNRRVVYSLLAVGALILILVAAGAIQELVVKPRQPVAVVNDSAISLQDYTKQVRYTFYQTQNQSGQPIEDPQGTSVQVLDQMIEEELVRQQAKEMGITVSDAEVSEFIEQAFGYYRVPPTVAPTSTPGPTNTPAPSPTPGGQPTETPGPTLTPYPTSTPVSEQAYQERLKETLANLDQAAGYTDADLRRLAETQVLQRKLYEKITAPVPKTGEQIHVRHILVSVRTPAPTPSPTPTAAPGATAVPTLATPAPTPTPAPEPRDEAQALARIMEVQQKIGAGEDFAKLAEEYSDDTASAVEGGDLSWVARDQGLVPEFEEAAFALEAGQVSTPVKTQFGYHIIQVVERDPARPLDEYTYQQKQYEEWQQWLGGVQAAAKVERFWSADKVPAVPAPDLTAS